MKLQEPLKMYEKIATKPMRSSPSSFKLFRTLYLYHKEIGNTSVALSTLGSLLRAEDLDIFNGYPAPKLTMFLCGAKKRKFPFRWLPGRSEIDFQELIDKMEEMKRLDDFIATFHASSLH
jgi:hypothetical protein